MQLTDNIRKLMRPADRRNLGKAGVTSEEAQAAFVAKSEGELQKQIASLLRLRGIVFINPPMHKRSMLPKGWPDFTFANNIPIAIEVKIRDNKATEEQEKIHAKMRENGWRVYVVRELLQVKTILDDAH